MEQIVTHCCQTCAEFGSTTVDFTTDADGLEAKKYGVIEVKDAISTKTMISFGIAGVMPQEIYHSPDGNAEYIPIMETPGVAFIIAERRWARPVRNSRISLAGIRASIDYHLKYSFHNELSSLPDPVSEPTGVFHEN